jgi:hypothetical protein
MTQQSQMFIRLALAGTVPMTPNANGLFTVDQVAVLASKRACSIVEAGDYSIEIKHPGKLRSEWSYAKIMAHDKGLWHPVKIFGACREAAGQPHYEVNQATAKIKNPGNLNEVLIAQIVGADGVRPYLSRPGQYEVLSGHALWNPPAIGLRRGYRERARRGIDPAALGISKADAGDWTWPMLRVMTEEDLDDDRHAGKSYDYRRAVRALDDAGLLKLTLGARGGFGTATFEWLPLAYLQPIERKQTLAVEDAEALSDLGALS